MLELKKPEIDDIDIVTPLLEKSGFMGCEYSFANNLAWQRLFNAKIARFKDFYIVCSSAESSPRFVFPAGSGDYGEVFDLMREYCASKGAPLRLYGVTDATMSVISKHFGSTALCEAAQDSFDYIYRRDDLAELRGKKYHAKRNHLVKFAALDPVYSTLCERDFDDCIEFAARCYNNNPLFDSDESAIAEQLAIHTLFENYDRLKLFGGVFRVDGNIAAFTVASRLNSVCADIHIEKADAALTGSFVAICSEFAKRGCDGFEYINREEDLGIDGLRKSKMSYHPAFLQKKYNITVK